VYTVISPGFRSQVQPSIDATAAVLGRLQERWPQEVVLGGGKAPLKTLDYYPYLFLSAFPSLTPQDIEGLSLAGLLYVHASLLYDIVMDRTEDAYLGTVSALRLQAMQMEASHLLYQLFPPAAAFWEHFRRYLIEYADACLQEQRFAVGARPWHDYTEPVALELVVKKNGLSRIALAGLVELSRDNSRFAALVEATNLFHIANQMWDDLHDWKDDLHNRLPSLLLSRLVPEWPVQVNDTQCRDVYEQLGRTLYYGGHAHYVLELALDSLHRADRLTADIPDLWWHDVTAPLRDKCQTLLQDVDHIVRRNMQRARVQPRFTLCLPSALDPWQQVAWDSLDFILRQWQMGFGEVRHIMSLPARHGFSVSQDYHSSDIFQRALIADALCDANELLEGQLQPWLDYEVAYLVSCRLTSGVGGWSYYPSVPEIAPDADDLGQVMQAMLRAGHQDAVKEYCEPPLTVLLRDNARPDGSLETWILPTYGRTPQQARQAEFNRSRWGSGPDNEVMANQLYALTLYKPLDYAATVQRGVTYLETQQEDDGSWVSKWYYGPYYGTAVCLRLFAVARPGSPAIPRALQFLRCHQHPDGGWGLDEASDPLSTALALLGLAVAQDRSGERQDYERAEHALTYLQRSQDADQGWPQVQFIRPRMHDPYGSRTITSMYVLKAAVAWHRWAAAQAADRYQKIAVMGGQ
jgi:squalene-hopene/tetraprenyl-beta-curcumene cyclase